MGIPWNFHPDSETYINISNEVANAILNSGEFKDILNNGYYIIVYYLGSNILTVTIYNIILFSISNILIYAALKKYTGITYFYWGLLLLLLNPYRMHLSTTCLKDTTIIFLSLLSVYSTKNFILALPALLIMRLSSIAYIVIIAIEGGNHRIKHFWLILLPCAFVMAGILIINADLLINWMNVNNEINMVFREFDSVPTFSEFGNFGIYIRAALWPLFYQTGLFFLLSPSIAYFPIFLGSLFNLIYCRIYQNSWGLLLVPYLGLSAIALFVSGFTTYLRYAAPILAILPILIASQQAESCLNKKRLKTAL
ncbi:MAG: hypothetical protein Q7K13_09575 [Polynucleobacter sp.]|uniref:hypothetical protein n=1 Tax=Polynucleobacter sp. TaxID=2029855 RepID=UPI00271F07F9|nr:hypothetical protein [Polynucleobacter sp.]MDO8714705.1 hypothetical protein [Polynucleobacter sp.]